MILVRSIDLLVLTVPLLPKPTLLTIRPISPNSPESYSSLDMPVIPKIFWEVWKSYYLNSSSLILLNVNPQLYLRCKYPLKLQSRCLSCHVFVPVASCSVFLFYSKKTSAYSSPMVRNYLGCR